MKIKKAWRQKKETGVVDANQKYHDFTPKNASGYLYYVRLSTELGMLYKIGFTTFGSVQERLGYKGGRDDDLVDKVLLFKRMTDAADWEALLHRVFRKKRAFYSDSEYLPLFRNGQSELYYEDVLGLDGDMEDVAAGSTEARRQEAYNYISFQHDKKMGRTPVRQPIKALTEEQQAIWNLLEQIRGGSQGILDWVGRIFSGFALTKGRGRTRKTLSPEEEKAREFIVALRGSSWADRHSEPTPRDPAAESLDVQLDILAAVGSSKEWTIKNARDVRLQVMLKNRIETAILAFRCGDLNKFEDLVDIPGVIDAIFDAQLSYGFRSDYLGILHNCGMTTLMETQETMSVASLREVMVRPLHDTYRPLLRYFVRTKKILGTSLAMPDEPLYAFDSQFSENGEHPYSDYFSPGTLIRKLGTNWTLEKPLKLTFHDDAIQFFIGVKIPEIGFAGSLAVDVMFTKNYKKIAVRFPNLDSLLLESARCRYPLESVTQDGLVINTSQQDLEQWFFEQTGEKFPF